MQKNNIREFILVDKKDEAENVTSLYFKPVDGLMFDYIPGQYVKIKPSLPSGHGKSYTISSISSEEFVCITIKRKGEVSSAIIDLKIGDKLNFDGPYGHFFPEEDSKEIVMLAGGIGITPFYSIIKSKLKSKEQSKIVLFYSNKTLKQTVFFKDLNKLSENNPKLKIIYCLTGENNKNVLIKEYTRINSDIIKKYVDSLDNKDYYVCGSIGFVKDMWTLLKSIGILEESIFTETFY
jgi:nitric oxide dioxygenase